MEKREEVYYASPLLGLEMRRLEGCQDKQGDGGSDY